MVINEKKISILESQNNKFTTDKLKRDELVVPGGSFR